MSEIKAVAVDMDGTFLTSKLDYDTDRFLKLLDYMKANDIKFVVASGNQYAQLKSFFKDYDEDITFISENGALVFENHELTKINNFDEDIAFKITKFLDQEIDYPFFVASEEYGYIHKDMPNEYKDDVAIYYFELKEYENLDEIPFEKLVKFVVMTPEEDNMKIEALLKKEFDGIAHTTSSGPTSIDITKPGSNKGSSLEYLLDKWSLTSENLLAFGDSNNDLEMLELANYSYAMKNASDKVKSIAKFEAPTNEENGVLSIIEELIIK